MHKEHDWLGEKRYCEKEKEYYSKQQCIQLGGHECLWWQTCWGR